MAYWRMQLHPSQSGDSMAYTVNCIAAGYVGCDFKDDPGDMRLLQKRDLPPGQGDYIYLAKPMAIGDKVLVFVHHFPFALVTIASDYTHIPQKSMTPGVWFRHLRHIRPGATRYYADFVKNARKWERIVMRGTIGPLTRPGTASYKLIERMK